MFLVSTNTEKHQFLVKRGLQQNFFLNLSFAKCEKLSFFGGHFLGQILVDVQKHYKIGITAHF